MSDRTAKYMHCQRLDGRAPSRHWAVFFTSFRATRQEQRETWLVCDDNPERNHRQQPRPDAERQPLEERSRFGMFLIFFLLLCGFFIPPAANHPDDEPRSCSRSSRLQVSGGAFAFSNES